MIPYIENYENPRIGDFFMVRTVRFSRNNSIFEFPVVDRPHRDYAYGLDKSHYHIDWRFMPEAEVNEHHSYQVSNYRYKLKNAEYFSPIMESEAVGEFFSPWRYKRDYQFPEGTFKLLEAAMKGTKMKKMKCPHHGTNLVSCRIVDDVVTCPQHGLKWNVKTGELVL